MSVDRFAIIGVPRSRTAWLSVLVTVGSCFCLHDGLAGGRDFFSRLDDIAKRNPTIRHVGNSDSGITLLMKPEELGDQTKFVVVLRGASDAYMSYARYFTTF